MPPFGEFDVDIINDETERTLGYCIFGYWHFFNSPDGAGIMTDNVHTIPFIPSLSPSNLSQRRLSPEQNFPSSPSPPPPALSTPASRKPSATTFAPKTRPANSTKTSRPGPSPPACLEHEALTHTAGSSAPATTATAAAAAAGTRLRWATSTPRTKGPCPAEQRRRIEKPTLLVTCTDDCVAVPAMQEGQMREFVLGMEVRTVKAGHWVQLEKAEEVNAILKDFLDLERCV
ncbi:MAG: hypothetical protein Q9208_002257 [Pyrenodesmia sp. 3 TL-2023]